MASTADDAMRSEGSTAVELSLRERAPLNVDESIESILAERSASKPGKGFRHDKREEREDCDGSRLRQESQSPYAFISYHLGLRMR